MQNANGDPCDMTFNIFSDPLFVGNQTWYIKEDSPCIDAGTSVEAPDVDIDGESRPQNFHIDIGADERFRCSTPIGHLNYCRNCGPCSKGKGNCEGDAECGGGLICSQDVGADYGWQTDINVCEYKYLPSWKAMPFLPLLLLDN